MKQFSKLLVALLLIAVLTAAFSGCAFADHLLSRPDEENVQPSESADYEAKLAEIVALLDEVYVDGYDTTELGDLLAEAAVAATGDRWSYYISAEDFEAYMEQSNNAYVGIGVTIQLVNEDDAGFTIVSVSRNSPAEAAGLLPDDLLVAVEGWNAIELGMTNAQKMVRGVEGTDVTITIERDGEQFDVILTRAQVETEVVTFELLESGDGYVKINNFDGHCARDTIAAIEQLCAQGAKSLIFDLRFNPGGHKDELILALDYLLPEGPLFRSVDYKGNETVDYSEEGCLEMPMAVIVNGDSYSAAEFFAAALQEYDWAVIVGTQTVGKANYQVTYRLSDSSAVAVSTGHYQTPNGVTLADVGVTPDVIVEVDEDTYMDLYYEKVDHADDAQLQAAIEALSK